MTFYVTPEDIILVNRTLMPTVSDLTQQILCLSNVVNQQAAQIKQLQAAAVVINPITWSQPSRSLDTDFVIDSGRDALVFYTVELTATGLISGTVFSQVTLNAQALPLATVKNLLTVTLGLGVLITQTQQKVLIGLVPAGQTVNLASSGTGTATLANVLEVLL